MDNEIEIAGPKELIRNATDIAGVSKDIVTKTAVNIQGRKYVQIEGWQTIAIAHGCVLSSGQVEHIENGIRAIGEVKRMVDGMIIATAEGFVGDDEKNWKDRDEYARRAMAQTRAMSRAARSAFAHVVVMMDAGLSTTPAEEVPREGFEPPQKRQKSPQKRQNDEALLEEMKTEGLAACKTIKQVESVARKWSERFGDSTDEIFQQGLDAIEERKKELNAAAAGMMEGMEDGSDKT